MPMSFENSRRRFPGERQPLFSRAVIVCALRAMRCIQACASESARIYPVCLIHSM